MSIANYARCHRNSRWDALLARRNKRIRRENYRLWWGNYMQKKEEKPTIILLYVR